MGHGLAGHYHFRLRELTVIELANLRLVPNGKVRRFHKGPRQILVAILGVALPLALAIAEFRAADTPTVGSELPDGRKPANLASMNDSRTIKQLLK